jgi:hypothetical protein
MKGLFAFFPSYTHACVISHDSVYRNALVNNRVTYHHWLKISVTDHCTITQECIKETLIRDRSKTTGKLQAAVETIFTSVIQAITGKRI